MKTFLSDPEAIANTEFPCHYCPLDGMPSLEDCQMCGTEEDLDYDEDPTFEEHYQGIFDDLS